MPDNQQDLKKKKKAQNNSAKQYFRYSGLAFEMIAVILLGTFGGRKIDDVFNTKPIFTAILSFLCVIIAIYFASKDFLRKQ